MTTDAPATAPTAVVDIGLRRLALPRGIAFAGTSFAFAGLYLAAGAPTPILFLLQQHWGFPAWALTVAFATYAFALIASLLVVGKLSDHVGRRPVIAVALAVQVVAMIAFVFAPNIGWVIGARALQGIATGAATSAFTASVVELAPERFKRLGSIIVGTAAASGLGLGALFAGIVVQWSTDADAIVFTVLAIVAVLGLVIALLSPETSSPQPGALSALVPRVAVPRQARREFAAAAPGIVGAWMFASLFMGLGPTIVADVFHIDSGAVDGVTAFAAPAAAAITGFLLGGLTARRTVLIGGVAVLVGTAVIIGGIWGGSLPLFVGGGIIGGVGFGASFSGALRAMAPLAQPHERAGLFAAIYVAAYLAFGLPAIIGGLLIAPLGLLGTSIAYAVVIFAVAAVGTVAEATMARRERAVLG